MIKQINIWYWNSRLEFDSQLGQINDYKRWWLNRNFALLQQRHLAKLHLLSMEPTLSFADITSSLFFAVLIYPMNSNSSNMIKIAEYHKKTTTAFLYKYIWAAHVETFKARPSLPNEWPIFSEAGCSNIIRENKLTCKKIDSSNIQQPQNLVHF